MFGSAFKPRAHYVFDYKPRFYNERKERLDNLKEKYSKSEDTTTTEDYKVSLNRNDLKNNWAKAKKVPNDGGSSKRLAIIIALLVGICAYLFELHTLI